MSRQKLRWAKIEVLGDGTAMATYQYEGTELDMVGHHTIEETNNWTDLEIIDAFASELDWNQNDKKVVSIEWY